MHHVTLDAATVRIENRSYSSRSTTVSDSELLNELEIVSCYDEEQGDFLWRVDIKIC